MQRLIIIHGREILHRYEILRPVLKHGTITTIGDQFMWMLRYRRVEIILDHHHDRSRLCRLKWIFTHRTCIHLVVRSEAKHIDATKLQEFSIKFRREGSMMSWMEISKRVLHRQLFSLQLTTDPFVPERD